MASKSLVLNTVEEGKEEGEEPGEGGREGGREGGLGSLLNPFSSY